MVRERRRRSQDACLPGCGRAAAKSAVTTPKYGWSSAVMPDVSDMDQSILERVGFDLLE